MTVVHCFVIPETTFDEAAKGIRDNILATDGTALPEFQQFNWNDTNGSAEARAKKPATILRNINGLAHDGRMLISFNHSANSGRKITGVREFVPAIYAGISLEPTHTEEHKVPGSDKLIQRLSFDGRVTSILKFINDHDLQTEFSAVSGSGNTGMTFITASRRVLEELKRQRLITNYFDADCVGTKPANQPRALQPVAV